MRHQVIYDLYPDVSSIVDEGDAEKAFDAKGKEVELNQALIKAETEKRQAANDALQYQRERKQAYPPIEDYIDGIVKGDDAQVQAYIDACLAVKDKYPKD